MDQMHEIRPLLEIFAVACNFIIYFFFGCQNQACCKSMGMLFYHLLHQSFGLCFNILSSSLCIIDNSRSIKIICYYTIDTSCVWTMWKLKWYYLTVQWLVLFPLSCRIWCSSLSVLFWHSTVLCYCCRTVPAPSSWPRLVTSCLFIDNYFKYSWPNKVDLYFHTSLALCWTCRNLSSRAPSKLWISFDASF